MGRDSREQPTREDIHSSGRPPEGAEKGSGRAGARQQTVLVTPLQRSMFEAGRAVVLCRDPDGLANPAEIVHMLNETLERKKVAAHIRFQRATRTPRGNFVVKVREGTTAAGVLEHGTDLIQ